MTSPIRDLRLYRDRMGVVKFELGGNVVEVRPGAGTSDYLSAFVQGSKATGSWVVYLVFQARGGLYVGAAAYTVDLDGDVMEDGSVFLQEWQIDEVDPNLRDMGPREQLDVLMDYL